MNMVAHVFSCELLISRKKWQTADRKSVSETRRGLDCMCVCSALHATVADAAQAAAVFNQANKWIILTILNVRCASCSLRPSLRSLLVLCFSLRALLLLAEALAR